MKGSALTTEQITSKPERPLTFSEMMRLRFRGVLEPIAGFLNRLGLMPNTMTIIGLIGNSLAGVLLARGEITWGGLLILLFGPIDALDGTMARLRGMDGHFGAFVDSVTDRYSELVIFGGLLYHYLQTGDSLACMLVFAAAAGSVLVSYVRARGESLGWMTKIGVLTRFERYLVLAPTLIFNYPLIGLWIIALLGNFTALQRILDIRRQAYA